MNSENRLHFSSEMVGHLHQDFLPEPLAVEIVPVSLPPDFPKLSELRLFNEPRGIFDTCGRCFRKVGLSWLDENLDDICDWDRFAETIADIDCLILVDDRICINPIMQDYARERTARYAAMFNRCGIHFFVVRPE